MNDDPDAAAEFLEGIVDTAPRADTQTDASFAARDLALAVESLPANQRDVVRLHYTDELTFREIAESLGSSLNTVKSWHLRALKALKKRVRDD